MAVGANGTATGIATGGNGGDAYGSGMVAGDGNTGTANVTAISSSGDASATATATGGDGGTGYDTASGGNGGRADATATAISGSGTATAMATATGGGGSGGGGGEAIANASSGAFNAQAIVVGSSGNSTVVASASATPNLSSGVVSVSNVSIGKVGIPGAFTLSGTANLSAGISFTVNTGSTFTITGGNLSTPSLYNNGTFNHAGGAIAANVQSNGTWLATGGSTRTITGNFNVASGSTLTSTAGTPFAVTGNLISSGTATVDSLTAGSLAVNAGTFTIRDQSTADNVSTVNGLSMQLASGVPVGTLDLKNNQLTIHYGSGPSPISTVQSLIASGYNGGAWTGTGITSSTAAARAISGPVTALGYADDGAGNVNIVYTLAGDATLDGTVNGSDLAILSSNFDTTGATWATGDFNNDGVVNGSDLAILANNFNMTIGATPDAEIFGDTMQSEFQPLLDFAAKVGDLPEIEAIVDRREGLTPPSSSVPEPASIGLLSAAAFGLLGRRRRR